MKAALPNPHSEMLAGNSARNEGSEAMWCMQDLAYFRAFQLSDPRITSLAIATVRLQRAFMRRPGVLPGEGWGDEDCLFRP